MFSPDFAEYFTHGENEVVMRSLNSPQYAIRHLARSSMYIQLVNLHAEMSTRSHLFFYEFSNRLKQALVCISVELLANPNDLQEIATSMCRYIIMEPLNVKTGVFKVLYALAALSHMLPTTFRNAVQQEIFNCIAQIWTRDSFSAENMFCENEPGSWESFNLMDILLTDVDVATKHYLQNGLGKLLALLQFLFFVDNGRDNYLSSFVADFIAFATKDASPMQLLFNMKLLVRAVAPYCKKFLRDRTSRFNFITFILDSIISITSKLGYTEVLKPSLGLIEIMDYTSFLLHNSVDLFTFDDFQKIRLKRIPFKLVFPQF
jgi:hypothetical protein